MLVEIRTATILIMKMEIEEGVEKEMAAMTEEEEVEMEEVTKETEAEEALEIEGVTDVIVDN